MKSSATIPAFVTFTGVDDTALVKGMGELSRRYPIEWGILIDRHRAGTPRFPDARQVDAFRRCGVRLCAHICGEIAQQIARGMNPSLNLAGFSRIQVNHGRAGSDVDTIHAARHFALRHGVRAILQCSGQFPSEDLGIDWLYDVSFGEGVRPGKYPALRTDRPFCGLSGGVGPGNVRDLVRDQIDVAHGVLYWLDMESGVRSAGAFDLQRCEAVCRAVYG